MRHLIETNLEALKIAEQLDAERKANGTLYADEIEIRAGLLTVFVWLFAHGFYRYRQMRWQRVIRRLLAARAL